jgi:hypothetical protein
MPQSISEKVHHKNEKGAPRNVRQAKKVYLSAILETYMHRVCSNPTDLQHDPKYKNVGMKHPHWVALL